MTINSEVSPSKYNVEITDVNYYRQQVPCQVACPAHTDAQGYVSAIAKGNYEEAYIIASQPNPFASICGRVCPSPCERACRRGTIDAPVTIRTLKRFICERRGAEAQSHTSIYSEEDGKFKIDQLTDKPYHNIRTKKSLEVLFEEMRRKRLGFSGVTFEGRGNKSQIRHAPGNSNTLESLAALLKVAGEEKPNQKKNKVAIIGAGPVGLTASHDLALLGYEVSIFETAPDAGGTTLLRMPEHRLPREILLSEITKILDLGVELKLNTQLEIDFSLSSLREQGFGAILIAAGSYEFICPDDGVALSEKGAIIVEPDTLATTAPGIFAGGDAITGPRTIINAVADGHLAARTINSYLREVMVKAVRKGWLESFPLESLPDTDSRELPRVNPPRVPLDKSNGASEVEGVYDEVTAKEQASRCLRCHLQTVFEADLCILCGGCVDVCPQNCYKMVRLDKIDGGTKLEAMVEEKFGIPLSTFQKDGEVLDKGTAMIKDETRCTRCGLCVKRCPTGAITMRALQFEEELVYEGIVGDDL